MLTNDQEDRAPSTVETLADAYQFARHNQYIVDLALLQLYASALVLAPDISIIKTQFKPCMPSWLLNTPKVEAFWPGDVLKFEGHTGYIRAIAFSSDDKLLGTCSDDGTARVWDTTDASCFLTVSRGNDYYPGAIAFSSDTSKIAVAYIHSEQNSPRRVLVTIYNTKTGTVLRMMQFSGLLRHGLCLAVAFESDAHDHDAMVAVVSNVNQVQVWRSVDDSNILFRAWTTHFANQERGSPIDVSISQDALLLCCAGILDENDHGKSSISVLDPKTGAATSKHGRGEVFHGMNFSGRTLVYLTRHEEWDLGDSGFCLRSFDPGTPGESTHLLDCVGFWTMFSLANAKGRVAFNPFNGHAVHAEKIPGNKRVGRRMQMPHKRQVTVAPKGDLVADWNGACLTILNTEGLVTQTIMMTYDGEKSSQRSRCMTVSPDGQYIALGHNEVVTVCNIETGQRSQYNAIGTQITLAISNDNKTLACAGLSGIILWDLESQRMLLSTDLRICWSDRRLGFSADGQDLITPRSRFHIATEMRTTLRESTKSSMFGKEVDLTGSVFSVEWVQFDGEDLLWIPDDYHTDFQRSDARGGTVALGQVDGSVMIMTFDLSML